MVASRWRTGRSKKMHAPYFTMPSSPVLQPLVEFPTLERMSPEVICPLELQPRETPRTKTRSVPAALSGFGSQSLKATPMTEPSKEQIIHRAYEIWEKNNKPDGRDEGFYHQAEQELRDEDKSSPLRTPDNL